MASRQRAFPIVVEGEWGWMARLTWEERSGRVSKVAWGLEPCLVTEEGEVQPSGVGPEGGMLGAAEHDGSWSITPGFTSFSSQTEWFAFCAALREVFGAVSEVLGGCPFSEQWGKV